MKPGRRRTKLGEITKKKHAKDVGWGEGVYGKKVNINLQREFTHDHYIIHHLSQVSLIINLIIFSNQR